MAQIIKKGLSYMVRVTWRDADGKQHKKSKGGFKTKLEARHFANRMEVTKETAGLSMESSQRFQVYFQNWFKLYKESSVSERTALTYGQVSDALKKHLNVPLESIDRQRYRKFMVDFGRNRAKSTVTKFNALIHACVKDALYDGVIQKDFVANAGIVYDRSRTRKVDYLTVDELKRLTAYLMGSRDPNYSTKYMFLTALYTGARLGELIQAVSWKDINFDFKTISINKAWNEAERHTQSTKNKSSRRTIRVNGNLLEALKDLWGHGDQVFLSHVGTIPTSAIANRTLREALAACGINRPGFHFHSLRHSHVAYLLANNVDLYAISKRLGHSDITTTSRVYSYMIAEYQDRTNQQIEQALANLTEVSQKCPNFSISYGS